MDGLSRCVGSPVDIKLGDRWFWIQPLNLYRLGIIEQHILSLRKNPFEITLEMLKKSPNNTVLGDLAKRAGDDLRNKKELRVVKVDELQSWLSSKDGIQFSMWLCLLSGDMSKLAFNSLKEVKEFFETLSLEEISEFVRRRENASGTGLLANFDWPASSGESKYRYIPWKKLFREFGEAWYWDSKSVGELTLYQLKMYRSEENQVKGLDDSRRTEELKAMGIKPSKEGSPKSLRQKLIEQGKFKLKS